MSISKIPQANAKVFRRSLHIQNLLVQASFRTGSVCSDTAPLIGGNLEIPITNDDNNNVQHRSEPFSHFEAVSYLVVVGNNFRLSQRQAHVLRYVEEELRRYLLTQGRI